MSNTDEHDHVDLTCPEEVAENANRELELRRKFNRGGTDIGLARARDLKNRRRLSPETIERMASSFTRHESDKLPSEVYNRTVTENLF